VRALRHGMGASMHGHVSALRHGMGASKHGHVSWLREARTSGRVMMAGCGDASRTRLLPVLRVLPTTPAGRQEVWRDEGVAGWGGGGVAAAVTRCVEADRRPAPATTPPASVCLPQTPAPPPSPSPARPTHLHLQPSRAAWMPPCWARCCWHWTPPPPPTRPRCNTATAGGTRHSREQPRPGHSRPPRPLLLRGCRPRSSSAPAPPRPPLPPPSPTAASRRCRPCSCPRALPARRWAAAAAAAPRPPPRAPQPPPAAAARRCLLSRPPRSPQTRSPGDAAPRHRRRRRRAAA
jgi:hypothetical protein